MADDLVLKLDGIEGECKLKDHEKQIDISSVSFGMSLPGSSPMGGGGGTGRAVFSDVHFTKGADTASNKLQKALLEGTVIKEAIFYWRKQGAGEQQEYMTLTLKDSLVTSFQAGGSTNGNQSESVSLNFAKYTFEYKEQQSDGSLGGAQTAEFDLKAYA